MSRISTRRPFSIFSQYILFQMFELRCYLISPLFWTFVYFLCFPFFSGRIKDEWYFCRHFHHILFVIPTAYDFNAEERYESEFLYDQNIKKCVTIILSHSSIPAILNFSFEKRDQLSSGESLSRWSSNYMALYTNAGN